MVAPAEHASNMPVSQMWLKVTFRQSLTTTKQKMPTLLCMQACGTDSRERTTPLQRTRIKFKIKTMKIHKQTTATKLLYQLIIYVHIHCSHAEDDSHRCAIIIILKYLLKISNQLTVVLIRVISISFTYARSHMDAHVHTDAHSLTCWRRQEKEWPPCTGSW